MRRAAPILAALNSRRQGSLGRELGSWVPRKRTCGPRGAREARLHLKSCPENDCVRYVNARAEYEVRYSSSTENSGSEEEDLERPFTPREPRGHSHAHPHRHHRPPSMTSQAHLQHGHHTDSKGQLAPSLKHIRLSSDFANSGERAGRHAGASTAAAGAAAVNGYAIAGNGYGTGYGNGPAGQSPYTQAAVQGHGHRGGPVGEAAEGGWWQQAACVRSGRRRVHGGPGVRRAARLALRGPGPHAVAEAGEGGAAGHRVDAAALVWWDSGADEARVGGGRGICGMQGRGHVGHKASREDMDSLWWQTASDANTQLDSGSGDVGALQRAKGGTGPRRAFPMSLAEHLRRSSRRFSSGRGRKALGLFSQPGSARTGAGAAGSGGGTGTSSAGPVSEAQQGSGLSGSDGEEAHHDGRWVAGVGKVLGYCFCARGLISALLRYQMQPSAAVLLLPDKPFSPESLTACYCTRSMAKSSSGPWTFSPKGLDCTCTTCMPPLQVARGAGGIHVRRAAQPPVRPGAPGR